MDENDARREETDREFEGLYRRHRVDVYRAAMRRTHDHYEAEDVTQSAFLDAYRAVLRGVRPELPRAWLLAIAENARRRRFAAMLRRPRPALLDEERTEASASMREEAESVRAALDSLPPSQRSAFILREVAGYSYAEIAERLEISVPAVQMLLFRARQSLRVLLAVDEKDSRLSAPAWLVWLTARFDTASVGARALGAAGTVTVVLAGVGVTSAGSEPRPAPVTRPRPAPVFEPAAAPAAESSVAAASRPAARTMRPSTPRKSPLTRRPAAAPRPTPMPASVAAAPAEVEAVVDVDAGPASPPTQPPLASAAGEDGRPAPALVPTVTTLEPEVLPVAAPEVIAVPVPEPPSVEGADLPALEVPPVPDVPVEVGDALPVLPGS